MNKMLYFAVGALIGSAVTWFIVKTRYKRIADEEIASVKEAYYETKDNTDDTEETEEEVDEEKTEEKPTEKDYSIYDEVLHRGKYALKQGEKEELPLSDEPYVIKPSIFGDEDDYEIHSFTAFADGVVTDDYGCILSDEEKTELIGDEALEHFGDYEDDPDTVYIRNDPKQMYIEICADLREYRELAKNAPDLDDE